MKSITREIKYEPFKFDGELHTIELDLTEEQMYHIEDMAYEWDVSYSEAFRRVWNAAFDLLKIFNSLKKDG